MAILWFLIDCNIFWNIFGTTENVTKSGPSDPAFITNIFQKIQETHGDSLEQYDFHIWEHEMLKILEGLCTKLFDIFEFELLKITNFDSWKYEKWEFENGNCLVIGEFGNLKIENLSIGALVNLKNDLQIMDTS